MEIWLETMGLAVALGCDAFAVGLGVGARFHARGQVFRLSFHFGFFQFFMPLVGWGLGRELVEFTRQWAPWIAFALLVFLGLRMAWESLGPQDQDPLERDPTRGLSLVMLSLATSLDALGVGFSLGLVGGSILWPAVVIGLTAAAMTWLAMRLGRVLSQRLGRRMGLAGGAILVAIAFKLVLD